MRKVIIEDYSKYQDRLNSLYRISPDAYSTMLPFKGLISPLQTICNEFIDRLDTTSLISFLFPERLSISEKTEFSISELQAFINDVFCCTRFEEEEERERIRGIIQSHVLSMLQEILPDTFTDLKEMLTEEKE